MTDAAAGAAEQEQDPFAPFRPRRGRLVAIVVGVLVLAVFGTGALLLPGPRAGGTWHAGDRIFFGLLGVAIAAMMWRYAAIRAVPDRQALTVRNLMTTRTIPWESITGLNFGGGDPWVTLDLEDTDTVAVMAIQKADAAWAQAEASRLAALVQGLGPAPHELP